MSSTSGIPPSGSPPPPSTTVQHQRDSLMRRRAISDTGAPRLLYNHTPSSAVNTPNRPHLSSHLLGLPSSQVTCGFGYQYGARSHPTDATYPSLDSGGITLRQLTDHIGGTSALGFEPGPEVGHPQAETHSGNLQDYRPPVLVVSTDDPNPALEFTSVGMITGTYGYSDSFGTPDKPEPEQWDTITVGTYMHPNQIMAPSFQRLRDSGSTGGHLLSPSPHISFDPPSSPSACSPSSASPLSLSNLGLNSPRSSMCDMDEGCSSTTYRMQEYQAQGEPNWGVSGRVVERVPVSPTSPPWTVNQTEPLCEFLQGFSPMTPASANMAPIGTLPDPPNTTSLPASVIRSSPLIAPMSAHSQTLPTEGSDPFTCLTGGPSGSVPIDALGPALLSDQTEFLFSILPGGPGYQPNNVSGTSVMNSLPSEIPAISGIAGPSFINQINTSYAGAPYSSDYGYPISSMGASGPRSAGDIDAIHPAGHAKFKPRATRGSIGKNGGRHRGSLENGDNNDLLHMSISSLEEKGFIQQASALKDTLRLIIRNCFTNAPTRQEIVDLLFDFLPENVRVRVAEPSVKKYYKERIGHILSAPANKGMFVNSTGGRWSLGEGPSH